MHTGKNNHNTRHTCHLQWNHWIWCWKGGRQALPSRATLFFHNLLTSTIQIRSLGIQVNFLLLKSTLNSKINKQCSDTENALFKLALQHSASSPPQPVSTQTPTLIFKFFSNHCRDNPESLKTGESQCFLTQCTEKDQGMTSLRKVHGYPAKYMVSYMTQNLLKAEILPQSEDLPFLNDSNNSTVKNMPDVNFLTSKHGLPI